MAKDKIDLLAQKVERLEKRLKKLSKLYLASDTQVYLIKKKRAKAKKTQRLGHS